MIVLVRPGARDCGLRHFMETAASCLDRRVVLLSYDEFISWPQLPRGGYIFADLDALDGATRQLVQRRWADFEALDGQARCLNHPARPLTRWAMLQQLAAQGHTPQRLRRADEPCDDLRFPVYLRRASGDAETVSAALFNTRALTARLERLWQTRRLSRCDIWVSECPAWRGTDGGSDIFSLLRVGDRMLTLQPAPAVASTPATSLVVGAAPLARWQSAREVRGNAQASLLQAVFEAVKLDYGRVDYAVVDGRLIVLDISSSMALPAKADVLPAEFLAALAALDEPRPGAYHCRLPALKTNEKPLPDSRLRQLTRTVLRVGRALELESPLVRLGRRLGRSNPAMPARAAAPPSRSAVATRRAGVSTPA